MNGKKLLVDHQRHAGSNRKVAIATDGPPVVHQRQTMKLVGNPLSAGHPCGGPPLATSGIRWWADVQLIAGGPLATLFASGGSPMVHRWQIPPSDCRLCVTGGPPAAFCCV